MVYTSIKADNTVAALDIPSIITVKIIIMNNNQKPPVAQLLILFPVFYTTHQFITIFTTAPLAPSHPIPLAHPPSVLTYILQ